MDAQWRGDGAGGGPVRGGVPLRGAALARDESITAGAARDPRALLGCWAFTRTIDDRVAGDQKAVDGTVTLTAENAGIRWFEEGTFHLGDQDLPVTRTLFVEQRDEGWFVVFEDGHDFHPWTTGTEVEHPCGADLYRGRIDVGIDVGQERVAGPRSWSVRWDVVGPSKDYTMITRLTEASGP